MLEQTRRQASIFIYLVFGLLIVIFILGINPGNKSGSEGCGVSSNTVVAVDGADANQSAYHVAYGANGGQGRQKVYLALDQIIRRELLAQAAADRGIQTSESQIQDAVGSGNFYLGGQRIDFKRQFFKFSEDGTESHFYFPAFKAWVNSLNVSESSYLDEQARSLQASLMNDLVTSSVRVSRDEALAEYLYDNNTVTYDAVVFDPARYRRAMKLTDADSKRFLDDHTAEVQARYKADERTYKGVKPQLALREIYIPKALPEAAKADAPAAKPDEKDDQAAKPDDKAAKPAKADDKKAAKTTKPDDKKAAKADDKKPAAGAAARPFGLPSDVAKARLEAVRAEILAKKLTFADAEKQLAASSAEDAPAENGDRGWLTIDSMSLGDKVVSDAAKALKPGEMTPVIVTDRGTYLVIATDRREGDLSFDQVKIELARELAKDVWSKEAAKRAALEALAKIQTSTVKSLEPMFEREPVKPPGNDDLQQIINDPNLTNEQKQLILKQYMQQMQQQKHGSLEIHEQDVPVAWYADADGSAQGTAPAAGSPAPAPAAGSASPAPAAGSAAPAPAAGSAPPAPAAGSAAPATPAPVEIAASKDTLPQFGEVARPKIARLGPTPRQAKLPGIGTSKDVANALFDELTKGDVARKIYEGDGGNYVLLQLVERSQPKVEEFDKTADAEIARMEGARGKAVLRDWLKSRCETLTKAGRIRPAPDRIRETDDKGNPAPTVYHPCMYFDYLDR